LDLRAAGDRSNRFRNALFTGRSTRDY